MLAPLAAVIVVEDAEIELLVVLAVGYLNAADDGGVVVGVGHGVTLLVASVEGDELFEREGIALVVFACLVGSLYVYHYGERLGGVELHQSYVAIDLVFVVAVGLGCELNR